METNNTYLSLSSDRSRNQIQIFLNLLSNEEAASLSIISLMLSLSYHNPHKNMHFNLTASIPLLMIEIPTLYASSHPMILIETAPPFTMNGYIPVILPHLSMHLQIIIV